MTDHRFYTSRWVYALCAALAPFLVLVFFAMPQTDDYCLSGLLLQQGLPGLWQGARADGTGPLTAAFVSLPTFFAWLWQIDLGITYSAILLLCVPVWGLFSYWLIGKLLPKYPSPSRLFFALLFCAAFWANAPTSRGAFLWLPGIFGAVFPALILAALFAVLYRALINGGGVSRRALIGFSGLLLLAPMLSPLAGWTGLLLLAGFMGVARWMRLQLAPPVAFWIALAAGLGIVLLAPGAGPQQGSWFLAQGISLISLPLFLARFLMPGIVGWFLFLGLLAYRSAPLPFDRQRTCGPLVFALGAAFVTAFIAPIPAILKTGGLPPDTALIFPFAFSLIALSFAFVLAVRVWGHGWGARAGARLTHARLRPFLSDAPLRRVAFGLMCLSPGLVGAVIQLPDAPAFRSESRQQALGVAVPKTMKVGFVDRQVHQPGLLFHQDFSPDGGDWPNRCYARYFGKVAVFPTN
jgi:hypothetical protein